MSLPPNILRNRLVNELAMCRSSLEYRIDCSDEEFSELPVTLTVAMTGIPGPVLRNGRVEDRTEHGMSITVTADYPYEKPIVRWQTPIFHPNIMLPRDGGYVCTKLLDSWSFSSNLLGFIKGVESLLVNPNPMNPYRSDSCMLASEKFIEAPYRPADCESRVTERRGPRIVS
ncbi:MAG: ubiquitin-conjugating enzyme E2 [Thermoplasmata archaeon]|nr:ubiquitin-conjugating enzyme E2 [Thermoplasmata archaeon]